MSCHSRISNGRTIIEKKGSGEVPNGALGLVIPTCLLLDHHLVQPLDFSTMPIRLSAELVYMAIQQLDDIYDRPTLLTLATTAHGLSDAALDVLWARPDLWNLAKRMDESLWHIEATEAPSGYDDTMRQKRVSDT
jgi:hypothetical protein